MTAACTVSTILLPLTLTSLLAADWTQYRGREINGVSSDVIRTNWTDEPPRVVWKVPLDPGLSSLTIEDGRVFTQIRRTIEEQDEEFCVALEADTGQELWAAPVGLADYPNGGVGMDDGPRSTPSIAGDRVVVLSSYLELHCLDAKSGDRLWKRDLDEFGATVIPWQNAASPLVEGDLVILNANGRAGEAILAFHLEDGTLAWKGHSDGLTHATPVPATIGDARQVIFFTQSGLMALAPDSGQLLWRYPLNYNSVSVAASPVVEGDLVYCSRGYPGSLSRAQAGALVLRISGSAPNHVATPVWEKVNQLMNHWATPVVHEGYLYGIYGQSILQLKCIEMATGAEMWSVDRIGYGSTLAVGGKILATSGTGILLLFEPDPEEYREIGRFQALEGRCWNAPAVSDGQIYLRTTTEAVRLDVALQSKEPALRAIPTLTQQDGTFRLWVDAEDGSPLTPARAAQISIIASDDPARPRDLWEDLTEEAILTDGRLRLDDTESAQRSQRFFTVSEEP